MKRLRTNASDDELLEAGREWIALLAEGRYDDAYAFLAPSEDWTPALIEQVITNYGDIDQVADGETFRVTPIATAKPTPDGLVGILEVDCDDDGRPHELWLDLPLNGEWSDVTATLLPIERDGWLVLETRLDSRHVM